MSLYRRPTDYVADENIIMAIHIMQHRQCVADLIFDDGAYYVGNSSPLDGDQGPAPDRFAP